jgi:hypothetical protein
MTEDQVGALLYELCVDLGFCPLGGATDPLYEAAPLTSEEFARAFSRPMASRSMTIRMLASKPSSAP